MTKAKIKIYAYD